VATEEHRRIGSWSARQVAAEVELTPEPVPGPSLVQVSPDQVYDPRQGSERRRSEPGRSRFWVGLAVGLMPLLIGVAALGGYLVASRDGGSTLAGRTATPDPSASDGLASGTVAGQEGSATTLTVTAGGASSGGGVAGGASDPSTTSADGEPSAEVIGGSLTLVGTFPPGTASAYSAELTELAQVLGVELIDESTTVGGAPTPAAVRVSYPAAVTFTEGSERLFENDPHRLFEAVAGYLNRGTAELTIVAYADPSDLPTARLALARAEHVHEHLIELGVEPARLAIETRDELDAPRGPGIAGPADDRTDLEFVLPS
jgi:outer membrane protein OmpA-like peptidoglycan-associated protein